MSSFNFNTSTTIALAATSLALSSSNASASRARSAYAAAVNEERESMGRAIGKVAEFREAATEMLGTIENSVNLKHVADPKEMKVHGGFLNLFEKDVPSDVARWAITEGRKIVSDDLKAIVKDLAKDTDYLAVCSYHEGPFTEEATFNEFQALDFYTAMQEQKGFADLGKNGAAIAVQESVWQDVEPGHSGISDYARSRIDDDKTPMEKKALSLTLKHFSEAVYNQIEKLREPAIDRITTISPAYEPA